MKKTLIALVAFMLLGTATPTKAFDLKGFLSGVVEEATTTDEFKLSSLEGTWAYISPAVSLKSDDALAQIGGSAANSTIEEKLSAYYDRLGIKNLVITFDTEANFVAYINKIAVSGVVTRREDKSLAFEFKPLGNFTLGKVAAKATTSANGTLELTFDATKIINAVKTISSYANNATLNSLAAIIDNYQGIYLGVKLKKESAKK